LAILSRQYAARATFLWSYSVIVVVTLCAVQIAVLFAASMATALTLFDLNVSRRG